METGCASTFRAKRCAKLNTGVKRIEQKLSRRSETITRFPFEKLGTAYREEKQQNNCREEKKEILQERSLLINLMNGRIHAMRAG